MAFPPMKVDRQATTPFLLKLFHREGSFTPLNEFHPPLPPHIEIHTWQNCTLRELSHILTLSIPDLLPEPAIGTRLVFRLVYPDTRSVTANTNSPGRFLSRELGSVVVGDDEGVLPPDEEEQSIVNDGPMAGRLGGDPEVMLRDVKFVIGDHIAIAILPPLADGSVAPPLAQGQGQGMGIGRGRGVRLGDQGGSYDPYGGGGGAPGSMRENGFGGFRGRPRGNFGPPGGGGGPRGGGFPAGEWRRGEMLPDGPLGFRGRGGYGGSRGRERW